MTQDDFIQELSREGFPPANAVQREPNGHVGTHTHPFEAKALILSGEIRIEVAGVERLYQTGDVFHLEKETPHVETYGPAGVSYLVGRK